MLYEVVRRRGPEGRTLADAHRAMSGRRQRKWDDAAPSARPLLTPWALLTHVAKRAGMTARRVRGSSRTRSIAAARALAARLMRVILRMTFDEIAGVLGMADASSAVGSSARADAAEAERLAAEVAAVFQVPA